MKKLAILLAILTISISSFADEDRIYETRSGAIKGYDPVAYFTAGEAVKGSKKITAEYLGATWRFSSDENKALFEENPEKYAPQYGGYCAFAMSDDRFVRIDPKAFAVVDGKLYLNYSKSVQKHWKADQAALIEEADGHWKENLVSEFGG